MSSMLAPPPGKAGDSSSQATGRFSVAVAAYQAAVFVGEAIESALDQTLSPLEVVVCDDGSQDGTDRVVESFGDRVKLVRREHGGEAAAKNAAAAAATGEFVVFLDADDRWLPERLASLAELERARPDLDILTTDAWMEVEGRRVRRAYNEGWRFAVDQQRLAILQRNFIFGHAAVRRERLLEVGGFDESIRRTTDWECWIRMVHTGSSVGLVAEPLAIYRLHPGALSTNRSAMLRGGLQTLEKARTLDLSPIERQTLEASINQRGRRAKLEEAREALREGSPEARRLAWALARDRRLEFSTRLKAVCTVIAPGTTQWLLTRRRRIRAAGDVALDPW